MLLICSYKMCVIFQQHHNYLKVWVFSFKTFLLVNLIFYLTIYLTVIMAELILKALNSNNINSKIQKLGINI